MIGTNLYTIGHSNRELSELIRILKGAGIETLVDIRAHPQSERHSQFNTDNLREAMNDAGITYHWAGHYLGGMRRPKPDSIHPALAKDLQGFADHMDTKEFAKAAAQLVNLANKAPLVCLCAERLPDHCHRNLIADYLTLRGHNVIHLIAADEHREHNLTEHVRRESAQLVYDRNVSGELDLV